MNNKSKKSLKSQKNNILLIIIVLVIVLINVVVMIVHFSKKNNQESQEQKPEQVVQAVDDKPIEQKSEQERIYGYARDFYIKLDNNEYEKAYAILNNDFKTKYFPTLASFEEYVNKYIGTGELTINFRNIERLGNEKTGNLYILWVNVKDVLGSIKKKTDIEEENYTNVVILEKGYNDYELSFSVEK